MKGVLRKSMNSKDGMEKKVEQHQVPLRRPGSGSKPMGFQRTVGRSATDDILHSKKEDMRSGDKMKRFVIGKERNDGEQNQDIREVSPAVNHVIKIQRIHRIKYGPGKSMDSSPQVESIILSPNQPYKSSARSSRDGLQAP